MKWRIYRSACAELWKELRREGWRAALMAATLVPFLPLWVASGQRGAGSGDFSHVFIIPIMALGILWVSRHDVTPASQAARQPSPQCAVALWGLGLTLRLVGHGVHEPLIGQAGFPLAMLGAIATLFGWDKSQRFVFPFLFLLFSLTCPHGPRDHRGRAAHPDVG
jgi:hypothetical protein